MSENVEKKIEKKIEEKGWKTKFEGFIKKNFKKGGDDNS
jgi:hypothetical protein